MRKLEADKMELQRLNDRGRRMDTKALSTDGAIMVRILVPQRDTWTILDRQGTVAARFFGNTIARVLWNMSRKRGSTAFIMSFCVGVACGVLVLYGVGENTDWMRICAWLQPLAVLAPLQNMLASNCEIASRCIRQFEFWYLLGNIIFSVGGMIACTVSKDFVMMAAIVGVASFATTLSDATHPNLRRRAQPMFIGLGICFMVLTLISLYLGRAPVADRTVHLGSFDLSLLSLVSSAVGNICVFWGFSLYADVMHPENLVTVTATVCSVKVTRATANELKSLVVPRRSTQTPRFSSAKVSVLRGEITRPTVTVSG